MVWAFIVPYFRHNAWFLVTALLYQLAVNGYNSVIVIFLFTILQMHSIHTMNTNQILYQETADTKFSERYLVKKAPHLHNRRLLQVQWHLI